MPVSNLNPLEIWLKKSILFQEECMEKITDMHIYPFLQRWKDLLERDILKVAQSMVTKDILCKYHSFFQQLAVTMKHIKNSLENVEDKEIMKFIPSVQSAGPNKLSRSVSHRQACLCALHVISASTAGGGREAKYDCEGNIAAGYSTNCNWLRRRRNAKASIAALSLSKTLKCDFKTTELKNIISKELNDILSYYKDYYNDLSLLDQNEVQMHLHETLILLKSLLPSAVSLHWALGRDLLEPLEFFMNHGSLRTRRLVFRIFRVILGHQDFEEDFLSKSKVEFVLKILIDIGNFYLLSEKGLIEPNYGIGDIEMNICCEKVNLLRTLQQCSGWAPSVETAFKSIAIDVDSALSETVVDVYDALGTSLCASLVGLLCIIGGHIDCFRVGASVKVGNNDSNSATLTQAAGTIIRIDPKHEFAQVVFNKSIAATPDRVKLSELVSVDEIAPDGKIVSQLSEPACSSMVRILQQFISGNKDGDKEVKPILRCIATRALGHLIQMVPAFASTEVFLLL